MNEIKRSENSSNGLVAGSIWVYPGTDDDVAFMLVEGYMAGMKRWAGVRLTDGALVSGWCDDPETVVDGLTLFATEVTIHLERKKCGGGS